MGSRSSSTMPAVPLRRRLSRPRSRRLAGKAIAAQADVSDPAAVERMFDSAEAGCGGVDVLVNNAGIMQLAAIADAADELFDRHIAVNLRGTFNTLREAARRLRSGGRIINLSSSQAACCTRPMASMRPPRRVLAKELCGRNITVNAVARGPTATALFLDIKPPGGDRPPGEAGASWATLRGSLPLLSQSQAGPARDAGGHRAPTVPSVSRALSAPSTQGRNGGREVTASAS
jgi:NAD(P)-dependent dehydrogenase (short-subunit alcohol dehydrogenase family)